MKKPALHVAIGMAIRRQREALGLSQEAFADSIGMHRTQFGAIEQGRKDCRLSTLTRVAAGLEIQLWQLIKEIEK